MNNDKSEANSPEMNLYTEANTNEVYEGKLFENFVLVKPVYLGGKGALQKISLQDFGRYFEDFQGNREGIRDFKAGKTMEITIQ